MRTLEWLSFFAEQRARHGKVVFSVAELANAAQTTLHALNTELGRLMGRGLIARYAHGRYGPTQGVNPEDVLPEVDSGAYITGFYALFRHHLVTQAPTEVACFTDRRHNRRADRVTPAGRLRFIWVSGSIYAKPAGQALATADQALCDFVWLCLRDGIEPRSLVTFRNLAALNWRRLERMLRRYPEQVRKTVEELIAAEGTGLAGRRQARPRAAH
jgi:hypothetical protein